MANKKESTARVTHIGRGVLGALEEKLTVQAYECPSCGREMTASGELWTCRGGHMRQLLELDGKAPWKDREGVWHDLRLPNLG